VFWVVIPHNAVVKCRRFDKPAVSIVFEFCANSKFSSFPFSANMRFMINIQPRTARSADCLGDIGSSTTSNKRTVCVYVKVSVFTGQKRSCQNTYFLSTFLLTFTSDAGKLFIYNLVDILFSFFNFDVQPTTVSHIKQQSEVKCHSSGYK